MADAVHLEIDRTVLRSDGSVKCWTGGLRACCHGLEVERGIYNIYRQWAEGDQGNFHWITLGGRCAVAKHDAYVLENRTAGVVRVRLGEEVGDAKSIRGDDPNVQGVRKGRVSQQDLDVRDPMRGF